MAYARKSYKRKSTRYRKYTRKSTSSKSRVSVKTRPRRVAVATKRDLYRLSKQVRRNTAQSLGDIQYAYQSLRWGVVPLARYVSTMTPIAILHQGIQANTDIHGLTYNVPPPPLNPTLSQLNPATWVKQILPAAGMNPLYTDHDQLQFYDSSQGVQAKYVHYKTDYEFNFQCVNAKCYVDIALVRPRKNQQYIRNSSYDATVVQGLVGFTNLCHGSNPTMRLDGRQYSYKLLRRRYFNTEASDSYLQTNPNWSTKICLRNPYGCKMIQTNQEDTTTVARTHLNIPVSKQMWLVISCSLDTTDPAQTPSAARHVLFSATRRPVFRDWLGASN